MNAYLRTCILSFILYFPLQTQANISSGQIAFQQGEYKQALQYWTAALQAAPQDSSENLDLARRIAAAYQGLGDYPSAYSYLQQAQRMAEPLANAEQQVLLSSQLADVLAALQQYEEAESEFERALTAANKLDNAHLSAQILNTQAAYFSGQQDHSKALKNYQLAATAALKSGNSLLQVQALNNQARTQLNLKQTAESLSSLQTAITVLKQQNQDYQRDFHFISIGKTALRLYAVSQQEDALHLAYAALKAADNNDSTYLQSHVYGYLGEVYERFQRWQEAAQLTQKALFLSQNKPDLSYQWTWQQGRILQAQGNNDAAAVAYRNALSLLQPIRNRLMVGRRDALDVFLERIRPVYFGLADILLQQAAHTTDEDAKRLLLDQARDTVELMKVAELEEYFQDECVAKAKQRQAIKLDNIADNTAILYPIMLADRLELLLSIGKKMFQVTVDVPAKVIDKMAKRFQYNLQNNTSNRFIRQATQLHTWLIKPIKAHLKAANVDTLVIVPDGALRMIPLSALYNRKSRQFLLADYAIAITPSLSLTDPRPLTRKNTSILLNGLSDSVQRFSALPSVTGEVEQINALYENSHTLLNREFSLEGITKELSNNPYSIVHIASHGQFSRDPRKTFLLTHDDKLTMNKLEDLLGISQQNGQAVELLTLSACQTAVGDERAALGLAGVAIKAGARSALASLWFVNDEATSKLIIEFYTQLQDPSLSKAHALRKAQLSLIKTRLFRHPAFWASFMLIGNWL